MSPTQLFQIPYDHHPFGFCWNRLHTQKEANTKHFIFIKVRIMRVTFIIRISLFPHQSQNIQMKVFSLNPFEITFFCPSRLSKNLVLYCVGNLAHVLVNEEFDKTIFSGLFSFLFPKKYPLGGLLCLNIPLINSLCIECFVSLAYRVVHHTQVGTALQPYSPTALQLYNPTTRG